ncbi:MAG: lysophospholipid acyltransferase family protein [Xanthomonadales bacterium]|nr:lysophospholipid acyltransferase family protein [Xanthomonadales bacterium]
MRLPAVATPPLWWSAARAGLGRSLARAARLDTAADFVRANAHLSPFAFVEQGLRFLDCRFEVDHIERDRLPSSGPLVVVANHPLGALDALALIQFIGECRRDLKVLANDWLMQLEPLRPLLLPVPVLHRGSALAALREARAALERGEVLLLFPAGEVSRLGLAGVRDGRWHPGFLKLAAAAQAPIVPIHVGGRNSLGFYGLSMLAKPLGTVLLPRQMFRGRMTRLPLRVGRPERPPPPQAERGVIEAQCKRIRQRLYQLPQALRDSGEETVARPGCLRALVEAISRTELLGHTPDGQEIRLGRGDLDSPLLAEIGRMREIAFRAVGEGSGKARDLDRFDPHYEQLLLWNPQRLELVGAYRLGVGARLLASHGVDGFYSTTLFQLGPQLQQSLPQALELGRSFVQPRYWNSRSLEYLWFGIGAYLRRHPQIRWLFGPVSISAALPLPARERLVAWFDCFHGADEGFNDAAQARRPFRYGGEPPRIDSRDRLSALTTLKSQLAEQGCSVPTLYKQYTELCEPGGARFLAFGVDPDFADCVDGLLWLDLQRIKPAKRARYIDRDPNAGLLPSGRPGRRAGPGASSTESSAQLEIADA